MPVMPAKNFQEALAHHANPFGLSVNTLENTTINKKHTLISLDTFYLYEAKQDGVSQGGVYKDAGGEKWLLKEPQWGELQNGVKEYVAGALFQHLLGDYAPKTSLIYDTVNHEVMVGSKFLPNFQTISDFTIKENIPYYGIPNGAKIENDDVTRVDVTNATEINGKPISNYANVITAVVFLNDGDAHQGNVGVVEEADAFMFAKIDHGFALSSGGWWSSDSATLKSFTNETIRYGFQDLDRLGYDNMYQSIKMVVDMSFDEIEALVSLKIEEARPYVEQWQQDHINDECAYEEYEHEFGYGDDFPHQCNSWTLEGNQNFSIDSLKSDILDILEKRQDNFKDILQDMELDHAIFTNDIEAIQQLFSDGIDFSKPIFSFHNSEDSAYSYTGHKPLELANKYHSDNVTRFIEDNTPPEILTTADLFPKDFDLLGGESRFEHVDFSFDMSIDFEPFFMAILEELAPKVMMYEV
tara:strand:+ start:33884 stop:35290 length:1407 start_codon:yes stop_codon:yes gene_type:complete